MSEGVQRRACALQTVLFARAHNTDECNGCTSKGGGHTSVMGVLARVVYTFTQVVRAKMSVERICFEVFCMTHI